MPNPSPTASVVVPTYNRGSALRKTLPSLLDQDYEYPYELIVVDDGSKDETLQITTEIRDPRIRVISQTNQGAAVARHRGAVEARSPIVIFHDSDDFAERCKVRVLVAALQAKPSAVAAFGLVAQNTNFANLQPLSINHPFEEIRSGPRDGAYFVIENPLAHLVEIGFPLVAAMNLAARRESAIAASSGRAFFRAANDYDMQLRLASFGVFVFARQVVGRYTMGDSVSLTRRHAGPNGAAAAYALIAACQAVRDQRHEHPELLPPLRTKIENEWAASFLRLLRSGRWQLAASLCRQAMPHHRIGELPRRLYWAYNDLPKRNDPSALSV